MVLRWWWFSWLVGNVSIVANYFFCNIARFFQYLCSNFKMWCIWCWGAGDNGRFAWVSSIIYLVVSRNLWARASSLTTSRIFFHIFFFLQFHELSFSTYAFEWERCVNEYRKYEVESKVEKKNTAIVCFDENNCNFLNLNGS